MVTTTVSSMGVQACADMHGLRGRTLPPVQCVLTVPRGPPRARLPARRCRYAQLYRELANDDKNGVNEEAFLQLFERLTDTQIRYLEARGPRPQKAGIFEVKSGKSSIVRYEDTKQAEFEKEMEAAYNKLLKEGV